MSFRSLALSLLVMVGAIAALHFVALAHCPKSELDPSGLSDFYPFSVFVLRLPQPYQLGVAAIYGLAFAWLWPRLARRRLGIGWLIALGLAFAILSSLLHGFRYGIDYPTATWGDGGIEYYHDAILIPGPLWLLERYNAIQFELLEHARTHPPGPVLLYWLLHSLLRHPAAISVAIAGLSAALLLPFLRRLLTLTFAEEPPGALALFTILPAWLVYGLAVVDAPIAGLFLGAIVCFVDDGRRGSAIWAGVLLFLSAMFSFAALFLLPVMVGFELVRRRRLVRSLSVIGIAALLLLVLKVAFGFDWLHSLLRASAMENEQGFLLLAEPKRYLWYRVGAVAEILAFFSPFLCLLWWRGRAPLKGVSRDGLALAWLGPAALGCVLLTGAFKIGEAARICLFILPYLMLPAVAAFRELGERERGPVAFSLLGFGVVMQLFGFYQW